MKRYIYFISYNFSSSIGSGFGNAEVSRVRKVEGIRDIKELEKLIQDNESFDVVMVMNYQLLREERQEANNDPSPSPPPSTE